MPGMGPPPKHPSERRRQNATIAMTQLPNEGYTGEIPEWPLDGASKPELARWARLWRTPQAAAWIQLDMADLVARYVRNCISVENGNVNVAMAYIVSEIRQQEDRLGRTPLAMLRLRWEVASNEIAAAATDEGSTRSRPRPRAVDLKLASEA